MERLGLHDLEQERDAYDALVARTPEIDRFCSSSAWVLSAHAAFAPEFSTWIARSEHGYVALSHSAHERLGRFRQPLEASWCLASPFVGESLGALTRDFVAESLRDARSWDLLFLTGLKRDGAVYRSLVQGFGGAFFVGVGPTASRYIASLEGGEEGFMSRRGAKFRANLRRIARQADAEGIVVEYQAAWPDPEGWRELYRRVLAVEARSWKGKSGTGIMDNAMQRFYRHMLPRLCASGALRALFLVREGQDVAFVFGGVFAGAYRGLQVSFDDALRHLSPGNLAQYMIIQRLCKEGVSSYDLGSELDYKKTWAEELFETVSVVIRRW